MFINTNRVVIMKKLSFNMLRGLFADIVNDTAKIGLYCFGKYKICIVSKYKEEDIEMLERYMILKENSKPKVSDKSSTHLELSNKRHRKTYVYRRKKKICIRCGDKNKKLEMLRSGKEGIMCKECGDKKRVIDIEGYHRRRDK